MDHRRIALVLGLCLVWAVGPSAIAGTTPQPPAADRDIDRQVAASLRGDADLTAVWFANPRLGWTVGDRGTIWHTADGGASWDLQESTVVCRLHDVMFLDETNGWAVGGSTQPFTHATRGVVLRTRDGGKHWTRIGGLLVPVLTAVQFFDAHRGMALGRTSGVFPSGAFSSEDGGRSWSPLPSATARGWLAGDFVDPNTGVVAGHGGAMATVRHRFLRPGQTGGMAPRSVRHLVLTPPTRGWLVGDGGLVLSTSDLGQSWQAPPGALPHAAELYFDFHAVAVDGEKCWVAGAPGSRVFHSADGGRSWGAYPTGNHAPIRALTMVGADHGWAVGALGTILATEDGGKTWRRQRGGGTRAAFLGVFGQPGQLPLELFSHLSAEGGYLGVAALVGRPASSDTQEIDDDWRERAQEAVVDVGGCGADTAWRFPVRPVGLALSREQLERDLDRANDGQGMQKLNTHLVRTIRMWRPSVIVTHGAGPEGDEPLARLIQEAVLQSVDAAADSTQYVDMVADAGLGPWAVERVFAVSPSDAGATLQVQTTRLAPRLGRSLAQHALGPRGLLTEHYTPTPAALALRPLADHTQGHDRGSGLFRGIPLAAGGEARRAPSDLPIQDIEHLKRVVQKHRNMCEILRQKQDRSAWLPQIDSLTCGLDRSSAGEVLFQLGQQYSRSGHWDMAAEMFTQLADKDPQHALAEAALVWLVNYYASGETAWRVEQQGGLGATSGAASVALGQMIRRSGPVRAASGRGAPRAAAASEVLTAARSPTSLPASGQAEAQPTALDERWTRATEFSECLEKMRPPLYADPGLRFPLAVAQRNLGYPEQADQLFLSLTHSRPHDAWWACAQGERWLAQAKGVPPKQVWNCQRADAEPQLDGRLDEPFWTGAARVALQSPWHDDTGWPAAAYLAYDGGFLYLAVECHKASGGQYTQSVAARPRDPDLSPHDRVDLLIDIDRDYASYYRLTVDHRGWTGEAFLDDVTWNPTWYVAAHNNTETWTVEAAIPWRSLVRRAPEPRHVWAAGVQRVVPGVGFQAWTQPSGLEIVPEGFGYVVFQ